MGAQYNVRVKCRNNYRYLFRLCDYWPATLPIINSGAEQWIASALFLAWDRHILDGGAQDKATLLRLIDSDELYKLLGVTLNYALGHADRLFDLYETVGYLDRFKESANIPSPAVPEPEVPEEAGIGWLDQGESDGVVERRLVERSEQKRDRRKAIALKRLYGIHASSVGRGYRSPKTASIPRPHISRVWVNHTTVRIRQATCSCCARITTYNSTGAFYVFRRSGPIIRFTRKQRESLCTQDDHADTLHRRRLRHTSLQLVRLRECTCAGSRSCLTASRLQLRAQGVTTSRGWARQPGSIFRPARVSWDRTAAMRRS